jgi:hypothetical protein
MLGLRSLLTRAGQVSTIVLRIQEELCLGFYTDWVLADEDEAEAVLAITTDEHAIEEWPHLSMKNVGEMDLMSLWAILRGEPEQLESITSLLARRGDDVLVCRVGSQFVAALAAVKPSTIKRLAGEWNQIEELQNWEAKDVECVLRQLVNFARRAKREGKPVLQLSVL